MERIWLKSYPAGVPADIKYDQYRSIGDLFEQSVRQYADRPAFHSMGKTMSFGELDRHARAFGAWLQAKGLKKGSRVAIMMPNCLQYPVAAFGTLLAGCTVANVNPLYTARELEHQLKDSGAEVIVILENFARTLEEVRASTPVKHVVVAALGDMLGVTLRDLAETAIIAGLTLGTLVVGAARQSGSLITARLASEAGREVFAIPGSIHNPLARGCHALIRQGAKLVESAQDIIEELAWPVMPVVGPVSAPAGMETEPLLQHLGHDPVSIDLLAERSGLTVDALSAKLLTLELEGHIAQLPGGRYQRLL